MRHIRCIARRPAFAQASTLPDDLQLPLLIAIPLAFVLGLSLPFFTKDRSPAA